MAPGARQMERKMEADWIMFSRSFQVEGGWVLGTEAPLFTNISGDHGPVEISDGFLSRFS